MKKAFYKIFLSLCLVVLPLFESLSQCAMCKATVESEGGGLAEGLNTGILYLMVVPYLLFTTIAIIWYRMNKKQKNSGL